MVELTKKNIDQWLAKSSTLGQEQIGLLEQFTNEYPYYGPTQALLAKAYFNSGNDAFEQQLRKAALTTADRVWLYDFIHNSSSQVKKQQPSEEDKGLKKTKTIKAKKSSAVKIKTDKPQTKKSSKKEKTLKPETKAKKIVVPAKRIKKAKAVKPKINKIQISPGEGDVITDLTKDPEPLKAKAPKLMLDETPDIEVHLENESQIEPQKSPELSTNNSFLDWLDYTNLNESGDKKVSIVKPLNQPNLDESLTTRDDEPTSENNVSKAVDLLAKFIANKPKPGEIKLENFDPEEKSLASDSVEYIPVSESLARVYISQNEVEMAKEVYQKLILKFPEKSAYFADLIQKLNKE